MAAHTAGETLDAIVTGGARRTLPRRALRALRPRGPRGRKVVAAAPAGRRAGGADGSMGTA